MSCSLPEGMWRACASPKLVFKPLSGVCGPVLKGKGEDFNTPPFLISCDIAALPSAPSVTVQGEEKAKRALKLPRVSQCWSPEHDLITCGSAVESSLWMLWKIGIWMRGQNWVLSLCVQEWVENTHPVLILEELNERSMWLETPTHAPWHCLGSYLMALLPGDCPTEQRNTRVETKSHIGGFLGVGITNAFVKLTAPCS